MNKHTPLYILVIGSLLFFFGQERRGSAFPQGPAINSGVNPIWSYSGDCTALSYPIPSGQDFIVTDLLKTGGSQNYASDIKVDGQIFARLYHFELLSFRTGFKVNSGSTLDGTQQSSSHTITLTGYLMAQ